MQLETEEGLDGTMSTLTQKRAALLEGRVQTTARWLDENRPGWQNDIDTDLLDIEHDSFCTVGQLHGSYNDAVSKIGGPFDRPVIAGVYVPEFDDEQRRSDEFRYLTVLWNIEVNSRRPANDQPDEILKAA